MSLCIYLNDIFGDMKHWGTLAICLIAFCHLYAQKIHMDNGKEYLPESIAQFTIGTSLADFQTKKDTATMYRNDLLYHMYIQFIDTAKSNGLTVYYKFDTPSEGINTNRPLYEIDIEFPDAAAAEAFTASTYKFPGRPSEMAEKEWFFPTDKDYWLLIRLNGVHLMIAANMSGTEWGYD
ncbi:MAG: hypothetical protein R2794_10095 [Chitinophagales bacterium]